MVKEGTVVAAILLGIGREFPAIRAWRSNTGAFKDAFGQFIRFGLPGSADISGIIGPGGTRLEIECKNANGKQSECQKAFEKMIASAGGVYILARSWEEAKMFLLHATGKGGRAA